MMEAHTAHAASKRKQSQVDEQSVPSQTKAKRGKGQKTDDVIKEELPEPVIWPLFFKELEKTHRALNLVFTFCCTRKHFATTFEAIRPAVEGHIRRKLSIEEVARVKAVRPEGINFMYVDEVMLELDVKGSERDDVFMKSRRGQNIAHDSSVGGLSGTNALPRSHNEPTSEGREILYFEFIDGDLKREVPDRQTGQPVRPKRKLREEKVQMPVYSQKQMTTLIGRRNKRFKEALDGFLQRCVDDKLDPEMTLCAQAQSFIPKPDLAVEPDAVPDTIPQTIPKERLPISDIVQQLKESSWYSGQIGPDGHRVFEAQEPIYGDLNFLLSQDLVNA
ncbi:hypothetical protein Golomagni_06785, partial [Golovinomyces magnicellulatus]